METRNSVKLIMATSDSPSPTSISVISSGWQGYLPCMNIYIVNSYLHDNFDGPEAQYSYHTDDGVRCNTSTGIGETIQRLPSCQKDGLTGNSGNSEHVDLHNIEH